MTQAPHGPRRALTRGRLAAGATVVLAGAAALALTLTGGDGSGSGSSDGSGSAGASSSDDPALQYARCMRDNGIEDFPDPQPSDDGGISIGDAVADQRDTEEFVAAEEACQHFLDAAPDPEATPLPPAERAELQDQWNAVAQCVRDQGHDFPTPEVDEWGRTEMDRQDAAVEQALEDCAGQSGPDGLP